MGPTEASLHLALQTMAHNHVHVWCYAHVLSLVLSDTTEIVIESRACPEENIWIIWKASRRSVH